MMDNTDVDKALGPYKMIERANDVLLLQYSKSLHTGIYIFTVLWIGIFTYLEISSVPISSRKSDIEEVISNWQLATR